ncbi:DUF2865 domain-containing protein [Bradyrhizobium genosp. L]|uniref:DUF2865 domain-containing protein n=1 Tax=Bradyrhizobium genosp. L TaxID=83637 RepID=UPI001FEF1975|nr:DUF2865 domain-containing protein [Bradyrhizobium genosp. L]
MSGLGVALSVIGAIGGMTAPVVAQMLPSDSAYAPRPAPSFSPMSYAPVTYSAAPSADPDERPRTRVYITTRSQQRVAPQGGGFCVRTCDGRYFPMSRASEEGSAKMCEAVCPGAEMKVYSGFDIENATTEKGDAYKKLANAFRFQREIVPQCSCGAKAISGLAAIAIEDDITLRTGDIVAADDGFKIVSVSGERSSTRRSIMFRPLSKAKVQALGLARISSR